MTHRRASPTLLALLFALSFGVANASVDVDLTVQNFTGFSRDSTPVTTGIPIALADTAASFALFVDDTTEIPVQTNLLRSIRTPWILLNFRATVPAAGTKTYRLVSQSPTVSPTTSLTITETGSAATIITGPLKVIINKNVFNLFDFVYYDANSDGVFHSTELLQNSTAIDNLFVVDGKSPGDTLQGNNAPIAFVWEEQGPLRAVLRVDGAYGSPAQMYYSTRMTFHAGQPFVTVEHVYRSSFQTRENNFKLRSAQVNLGGKSSPPGSVSKRISTSGEKVWLNVPTSRARVQLIPDSLVVLNLQANPATTTKIGVDANGGLVIPDWSYHGATIRFDFSPTLNGTVAGRRDSSFRDPLLALAPAEWYSDLGAFGAESFGTFQDELDTYTKWGWSWGTGDANMCNDLFNYPRMLTLNSNWSNPQLMERNSDQLWMNVLMYARTGNRFFMDKADALARYWKWECTQRTDGFTYAGGSPQFPDDDYWDGPPPVFRDSTYLPVGASYTTNDSVYIKTAIAHKLLVLHTWNAGIIDYYYMTGDRDALMAGLDLAEKSAKQQGWLPDTLATGSNVRFAGRNLLNVLRAHEATGASAWRTSADHMRNRLMYSTSYDSRGFWGSPICEIDPDSICTRFPSEVGACPDTAECGTQFSFFQAGAAAQALYRDYVLTGDTDVRDRLLELADFALQEGTDPFNGLVGDYSVADSPRAGDILHVSTATFFHGAVGDPRPPSSLGPIDILTIGYRITNDEKYLSKARQLWDHASRPIGECAADEDWVPRFQNSMRGYDPAQIFPDGGDLTTSQFFFHDAARAGAEDTEVPDAVSDLLIETGRTSAAISWTCPGDDGDTGTAEEFDLRISSTPITSSNFLTSERVPTDAPASAGNTFCVEVGSLSQCHTYYAAVMSRDESGNWSPLSNVDNEATKCSGSAVAVCTFARTPPPNELEADANIPRQVEFALHGSNPTSDASMLAYGIPAAYAGQKLRIDVHDLAGRRVRTLANGLAKPGRFNVSWNLATDQGHRVSGGVYFLRFELGNESRSRKIILVR